MLHIHRSLRNNAFPSLRGLSQSIEVNSRTIKRDIAFMRDSLRLPIEWDAERRGYRYTEPVAQFPPAQITEGELVALMVAEKVLRNYANTPFEAALRSAFQRITEPLTETFTFSWSDYDQAISFRLPATSAADLATFEDLSKAILARRTVTFQYRKLQSRRWEDRRVQPLHLANVEGGWYLVGHDCGRNQLRTFALPRIRDARVTYTTFTPPADFSPTDFWASAFGAFTGKGRHRVRVRFDAFAAQLVRERTWHASQRIEELLDGELEIEFTIGALPEVQRWILSFGSHAQALAPKALVDAIRAELDRMTAAYSDPNAG